MSQKRCIQFSRPDGKWQALMTVALYQEPAKCQVLRLILTAALGDCVFLVHGAGNSLREVRRPTQGHTASKWQTGIWGPVFLMQKRMHLPQTCTAPGAPSLGTSLPIAESITSRCLQSRTANLHVRHLALSRRAAHQTIKWPFCSTVNCSDDTAPPRGRQTPRTRFRVRKVERLPDSLAQRASSNAKNNK